jgi:hypothetical protein
MGWFSRKKNVEAQVKAAARVATNLYFLTVPGGADAVVQLEFIRPDSRYRYLLFCMSATAAACAREMDDGALEKAVYVLTEVVAQESAQEYFGGPVKVKKVISEITPQFQWLMNGWAHCVDLEREERVGEVVDMISAMIRNAESALPSTGEDVERLKDLASLIYRQFPGMRRAYIDLLGEKL